MKTRSFNHAFSRPWAITPEALQLILEIAAREHIPDFEAVAAKRARRVDQADTMTIREGGVAILPVVGPIFRYSSHPQIHSRQIQNRKSEREAWWSDIITDDG